MKVSGKKKQQNLSSVQHNVSTLYFLRNASIRTKVSGITSSVTYVCTYRTSFFLISRRIARYLTKQNNNLVDVFTKGRTIYLPVSLTTYIASTTYTHTLPYIHIRTYIYISTHGKQQATASARKRNDSSQREEQNIAQSVATSYPNFWRGVALKSMVVRSDAQYPTSFCSYQTRSLLPLACVSYSLVSRLLQRHETSIISFGKVLHVEYLHGIYFLSLSRWRTNQRLLNPHKNYARCRFRIQWNWYTTITD